jgi:hypothetical protein
VVGENLPLFLTFHVLVVLQSEQWQEKTQCQVEFFMFLICCKVRMLKENPSSSWSFLVLVTIGKNLVLIGLHVFIVWRHYWHQGENLTSVCMCVGVCVILFIYFVVGVVDLCVYGNIVGCLQEKLIVFNSLYFYYRNVTLNYNLHNNG